VLLQPVLYRCKAGRRCRHGHPAKSRGRSLPAHCPSEGTRPRHGLPSTCASPTELMVTLPLWVFLPSSAHDCLHKTARLRFKASQEWGRTAEAVAALMDDPHRFRHAKAVGRYFGLVPCQTSWATNKSGHITREDALVVRQPVAEAARATPFAGRPQVFRARPAGDAQWKKSRCGHRSWRSS
jgi:Transposase IS116/IS110/IS902 family